MIIMILRVSTPTYHLSWKTLSEDSKYFIFIGDRPDVIEGLVVFAMKGAEQPH